MSDIDSCTKGDHSVWGPGAEDVDAHGCKCLGPGCNEYMTQCDCHGGGATLELPKSDASHVFASVMAVVVIVHVERWILVMILR